MRDEICTFEPLYRVIFVLHLILLVMLAFSFQYLERGTPTFMVWLLSVGMLLLSGAFLVLLLRWCTHADEA